MLLSSASPIGVGASNGAARKYVIKVVLTPGTTEFSDLMDQVFHLGRDWARLMRSQSLID